MITLTPTFTGNDGKSYQLAIIEEGDGPGDEPHSLAGAVIAAPFPQASHGNLMNAGVFRP